MNITYHASSSSMGNIEEHQADKFRQWARKEIESRYPDHVIDVSSDEAYEEITDDEENKEQIEEFCARLWDKCPWDWE